ncbi:MAG: effector binding domain-containing protein, partial [Bacillota bacterium]|nr:effector binding domain-containing protein [Bacillota bacterium]
DFMTQWGARNGIDPRARRFGFDSPVSEDQQKKGQRGYEYWISVPENTPASDGVVLKNIEECKYAVLRITDPFADPFDRIPQAWNRLVEWVSNLEHKHECCQQKYCLEEVIEVDGITYMDLFLPIS